VIDAQEQLENTKRTMNEKLGAYGINIWSITITNVLLPPAFRSQMEEVRPHEHRTTLTTH
jgi:regulator of protease activity HflC (stomatin/prohibitin superfamily)